ncbi:MAG: SDR family NAD(P)-dependent oxidoreductase, partial [Gemmataceae bacterium]
MVLVTGAASGIGRATALLLSQEGATVVVADIAAEPGQQVVEEIARNDGKAVFHALDVSQEVSWKELIDKVLRDFDHLDVAVNNAGVAASQSVMDMPLDEWRR